MAQAAELYAHFPTNVNLTANSHADPACLRSPSIASPSQTRKPSREEFTVAIFCALPLEAEVVDAFFHTRWKTKDIGKPPGDTNTYTLGAIGKLNVVLVHLGGMGKISAANAAANCSQSFLGIELALIVGICGGIPSDSQGGTERVLGDILVSEGLVEHDFGRQYPGRFIRKKGLEHDLSTSSAQVRGFLTKLKSQQAFTQLHSETWSYLNTLQENDDFRKGATYPGNDRDALYESSYIHKHWEPDMCENWLRTCATPKGSCEWARDSSCEDLGCDHNRLVSRKKFQEAAPDGVKPRIHFGLIASGDRVMKSGEDRDQLAKEENIIGIEMEGAGAWEVFPCVVIKALCDYADSHKSKVWQNYAAATAGACMAAFLDQWASNGA